MRKITKLMLALLLCVVSAGVVNARTSIDMRTATTNENAAWDAETNTFSWTAEDAYVVIPGLSGDLTGCYLDFTISAACHISIVYTDNTETIGDWNGYGRFGSGGSKTQDLGFMAGEKINSVKEVRICSQSSSGNLTLENVSYYYPVILDFDASGVATVNFKSIITSGGIEFDPVTGVVTNTNGTGALSLDLPGNGIDLSSIKRLDVTYTGTEDLWGSDENRVLKSLEIAGVNTWQGSRYGADLTNYANQCANVRSIQWNAGGKVGGSITITAIKFTTNFVNCGKAGETMLNTLPWNKIDGSGTATPDWNMNGTSDTYYGNYSGDATHYVDLTDYDELRVYCASNSDGFRAFFIKADGSGTDAKNTASATWNATDKYYSIDLSTVTKWNGKVALKSIKSDPWSGTTGQTVTNIVVYKTPAAGTAQYLLFGRGVLDAATKALLDDANVTSIDATGMTNVTAAKLTSANPNCLFIANAGKLSNANNVIVDGTCANLVLTDGHPFAVPGDHFTATSASYTTTINATAQAGTLALPFAAAIPEGVKAYTLFYTGNDKATASEVTSIEANAPVLLNGSGEVTFTGADTWVTIAPTNGLNTLVGVYEETTVPTGDYVLQNGEDGVGFYKVSAEDPITINPFRAYLTTWGAGAAKVRVIYEAEDATAITSLEAQDVVNETIYNLNGMRISHPTKGIYIKNGKKFIVK